MTIPIIQEVPRRPTTGQMFGQAFANVGAGLGQNISQALQGRAEKQKLNQLGFDIAGISDPNIRNLVLQDQMTMGRKLKQAKINADVDRQLAGEPTQTNQSNQRIVEDQPDQFGNVPQPETAGRKEPILSPTQIVSRGQRRAQLVRDAGGVMTDEEGIALERTRNDERRQYNQDVEADTKQRVATQRDYGDIAEDKLLKYYPDAPPDMVAEARRFGEEAAKTSTSEAEINRKIADRTTQMKNVIANVKNSTAAPTIDENLRRSILGNDRKRAEAINDMRIKLDPLLKDGHYDTARALLAAKNWSPESIESIISDLGEGSRKAVGQMPKLTKPKAAVKVSFGLNPKLDREKAARYREEAEQLDENNRNIFNDNIRQVFASEPSVNLILLRKAYGEKNVDWRTYKNAINDMIFNGELQLNDDQFKQLDALDEPAYNELEKIMKAGNIID